MDIHTVDSTEKGTTNRSYVMDEPQKNLWSGRSQTQEDFMLCDSS